MGDFITVHYYKLGFEDDEFYLPENLSESSFKMVVDRFSCDYSGSFATNAICDDGKDGKKTFVSSDGQVTFGDYVSAVWYKIEVH